MNSDCYFMVAFIDLAEKEGAGLITPIAAETWPSGTVHSEAYERIAGAICGDGFHTHNEYLLVSSLVPRTQLLMRLFKELT